MSMKGMILLAGLAMAWAQPAKAGPAPVPGKSASAGTALEKQLAELNSLSGTVVVRGKLKELLEDKEGTRKLVAETAARVKDKKLRLNYHAAHVLALAAAGLNDLAASETFYRLCMEDAVKMQSPQRLLESYGGLIDVYYDNKKYAEAAGICRELLELKTDDGKPRVVIRAVKGRFGDAEFMEDESFDSASRLRPGVHRLLIQILTKQGKHDQALKLVDNLIKATDHWQEWQLRAGVLREAGKFAEAAKAYEDVIERVRKDRDIDPEERDLHEDRYRYLLSNVFVDLKQIDKAAEQLQTLIKKKPDEPGYQNDLGYIWADHDMNLEEAEKLIRSALDLDRKRRLADPGLTPEEDRENGAYLDSMGWVLFKQKKNKEALEYLLKAVDDKKSQHIEIYDHLGDVYMALGNRDKALEAWRKGLEFVGEGRRELERKEVVERKIEKYSK